MISKEIEIKLHSHVENGVELNVLSSSRGDRTSTKFKAINNQRVKINSNRQNKNQFSHFEYSMLMSKCQHSMAFVVPGQLEFFAYPLEMN